MKPSRKRTPTPEELKECQKLNDIYESKKSELNITQEAIAAEMGISQPGVGHYLKGRNPLNIGAAIKFASILKVPVREFSPRLHNEIQLSGFGDVPDEVIFGSDTGTRVNEEAVPYRLEKAFSSQAPLIDWKNLVESNDPSTSPPIRAIPTPFKHGKNAFCLIYQGDAMTDYREGEFILIDPAVNYSHNDDVLVLFDNSKIAIRKLQITPEGSFLVATNPDHPSRKIEVNETNKIFGPVTGSWLARHTSSEPH